VPPRIIPDAWQIPHGHRPRPGDSVAGRCGAIYKFPFSYRGGIAASVGFLLAGGDGHPFLCVGVPTAIEFVGLKATAAVVADAGEDVVEDDAMDFSLV
jgi:hypothetical protein